MGLTITDDNGDEYWTAHQCASHCGVSFSTWTAYVARGQAPRKAATLDRLNLWQAAEVEAWHAARPSQNKS